MIFTSPHADVPIPAVPFHEFLLCHANELNEKPAFIDAETGGSFTYRQLVRDIYRCAGALTARGLRKGDVFALLVPNIPEFATAFYGVLAAGGVITTLNPLYTADEIAHQLEDCGAKYLLTLPQLCDKAVSAAAKQPIREIFVVGEANGATPFSILLQSNSAPPSVTINAWEDLAVLPYSSGTSGKPKGVMLTHANLIAGVLSTITAIRLAADAVGLGILPFFHITGMVCILHSAMQAGRALVLMRRFDPESFLRTIQKYSIHVASLVPPIVIALVKHPAIGGFDISSLKLLTSGGAPLGAETQLQCANRLHIPVVQGYGMTEACGVTHFSIDALEKNKPGTVGRCVPNLQCKVVDALTARELGPHERGELWLRGPQVMKGYLNNPRATAESWIARAGITLATSAMLMKTATFTSWIASRN